MIPIVYANASLENPYDDGTILGSLKDRFKIVKQGEIYVSEINLKITKVQLPLNVNKKAYIKNMKLAGTKSGSKDVLLAPKTDRLLDYYFYNNFQKLLFAYSVAKSAELILRLKKKSIKNSCICIFDAADEINKQIIFEIAKRGNFIVLISKNIRALRSIQDYVMCEYGVTPVITSDFNFAFKNADFIVSSASYSIDSSTPVWYVDNKPKPINRLKCSANDVVYRTPWNVPELRMTPEIVGAILSEMQERNIEKSLKYNDIFLDEIRFNDLIL